MSVDRTRWQRSWPKRLSDIPRDGLRVQLRREVRTALGSFPRGYEGRVTTSHNGWHLLGFEGKPCDCCGVRPRVSRLSPHDLELIDANGVPLP